MEKVAELIYVSVEDGKTAQSNKYYKMKESGNKILVEFGRVGGTSQNAEYSISEWDKLLKSKVKKGYKDVTALRAEIKSVNNFIDISDKEVLDLISMLQNYSNKSIQQNYTISSESVTEQMVDEAQKLVDEITGLLNLKQPKDQINKLLLELYKVIPRKMKDVKNHIFQSDLTDQKKLEEAQKLIGNEQATLDVMRQQVDSNKLNKQAGESVQKVDILGAMGLTIIPVKDSIIISKIKSLMGPEANQFHRAFEVENKKTKKVFDNFVNKAKNKKLELFWHGSRNENWLSIIETGLVLRPANAVISGKMFGYGTYFADKFRKSLGYTSYRGSYFANGSDSRAFLALYEVHVGNQFHIKHHQSWCYDLNEPKLKAKGDYDSLFAEGGADLRNNEFIVYNEDQTTIKYLVEIK